jgi:transposase
LPSVRAEGTRADTKPATRPSPELCSPDPSARARVSASDDAFLRGYLYEAATVLINRLQRPCARRIWVRTLVGRIGVTKARGALARKLAVLLHHLWSHEEGLRRAQP